MYCSGLLTVGPLTRLEKAVGDGQANGMERDHVRPDAQARSRRVDRQISRYVRPIVRFLIGCRVGTLRYKLTARE